MKPFWDIADFVRKFRREMRFGELSRAPLRLLRLELHGETAKCEWVSRPEDPFDAELALSMRLRNQALQALKDAVSVRAMLFDTLPDVRIAEFRVYRQAAAQGSCELIITGLVTRAEQAPPTVRSPVMRAKLCGLHFSLEDGALEALQSEAGNLEFAI
jgi:hypothetical protein